MSPQIITNCGNVTLNFKQSGFCASPPILQTPIVFHLQINANFTFIWKKSFTSPSYSPVLFLLNPGEMLVAYVQHLFVGSGSWYDDSSLRPLIVMHPESLEWILLDNILQFAVVPVPRFPTTRFFLHLNFLWICLDTTTSFAMILSGLPSLGRVSFLFSKLFFSQDICSFSIHKWQTSPSNKIHSGLDAYLIGYIVSSVLYCLFLSKQSSASLCCDSMTL